MSRPSSDVSVRPRGASSTGGLDVERLTGSIGAVLHGLDLSVPLFGPDVGHIRELVAEHQVVFARDQHLDEEQHRTLASQFGALSIHPVGQLTGSGRAISVIDDVGEWARDL